MAGIINATGGGKGAALGQHTCIQIARGFLLQAWDSKNVLELAHFAVNNFIPGNVNNELSAEILPKEI